MTFFEQFEESQQEEKHKKISGEAVAIEVGKAISDARLTFNTFVTLNYDTHEVVRHIKSNHPIDKALFSEDETQLYEQAITLSVQYILGILPNLPGYTSKNFTEILQRIDKSTEKVKRQ